MAAPLLVRVTSTLAVACALLPGATPVRGTAQEPPPDSAAQPDPLWLHIQARWIHENRAAEFVPFGSELRRFHIGDDPQELPPDLKITLPLPPLTPGLTWTDTVAAGDERPDRFGESHSAIRTHRIVGDTLVDGRLLPVVRIEATVRHRSAVRVPGTWWQERRVTGTTVGVAVADPATGILIGGADTARWQGTATLHDTVSGPFTSGVRYEGVRTWTWIYAESHQAVSDAAFDSIRAARPPPSSGDLWRIGRPEPGGDRRGSSRSDSLQIIEALARGDTVAALRVARMLIRVQDPTQPLTRFQAEFLLPYLDDPARLWRLGAPEDYDFVTLAPMLFRASPLLEPDTSRWACEPAACQLFLDQLDRTSEPRLRDAALVGLFARDPARWHDRLVARHEAGSRLTGEALALAQGRLREDSPTLPSEGADWRAWQEWWRPPFLVNNLWGMLMVEPRARWAIRLHTAVTGRDPVAELLALWPPAGDSARLIVGEILRDMDAIPDPTAGELMGLLLSGDSARIHVARRYVGGSLDGSGETMPPQDAVDLLAPLVDSLLAHGNAPWPAAPGTVPEGEARLPTFAWGSGRFPEVPVFVATENLPPGLLDRLPPGVRAIGRQEWDARDPRAGGYLLEFDPVRPWGPFARIEWRWTHLSPRAPDQAPWGHRGGGELTLMETDAGWVMVARSVWSTIGLAS